MALTFSSSQHNLSGRWIGLKKINYIDQDGIQVCLDDPFLCHTCILPSSLHSALGNAQNARRGVNLVQTVCVIVRCLTPDADADFLSSCGHSRDPALQDKRVPIIDSRRRTIPTADRQSCRRCVLDRRLCMCPVQCSSYL